MNCIQIDKLCEAYVDGRLAPDVMEAIREHANTCAACRKRIGVRWG